MTTSRADFLASVATMLAMLPAGSLPVEEREHERNKHAKLAARSELAAARGAYAAAERVLNAARGRLSKARAAAKKLGLDL